MSLPSLPVFQQLHHLDKSSPDFHDQLCNVFYGSKYSKCVPDLQGDDLVWLVDYLDKALDCLDPSGPAFRKCLRELRSRCGAGGILPTSYTISPYLLNVGSEPFASGGYGDVYEGTLDGSRVCIKRVRVYTQDGPQKAVRTFCQQAVMWKYLTHPNIVPLLGVTITPFQLISNWMSGGDLPGYIEKHPNADRLRLLSDVAKGLHYLHSCSVVHGDLKGPNILTDDSGNARIADFGFSTAFQNLDSLRSIQGQCRFTPRWTAPEVLDEGPHSKEADIFSFAMVMIEVFTGAIPFSGNSPAMATLAIAQGRRPQRPVHPTFTDNLWMLMQRCWDQDPHLRPEVSEILQVLLTPAPPAWKRLTSDTLSMDERISLLSSIFTNHNEVESAEHLSGDDAQAFVDVVAEALGSLPQQTSGKCLRTIYKICGRQALLPRSLKIPLCYDPMEAPHCHGGFGDVWKGQYVGQEVAAKTLRVSLTSDLERIRKRFCKEVAMWNSLRHPNVLPLLGVTMTETQFVMVSEWMVKGNIGQFLKADINADRLGLLGDITRGLIYTHAQGIIHGDLKGTNVLIKYDGHACISDFGLPTIISDPQTFLSSCIEGGVTPWMSPELIDPASFGLTKGIPTKESDCYALGMVVYEVLSGRTPFAPFKAPVLKILRGERPGRPRGMEGAWFTTDVWWMLELCWKHQPGDRPSLDTVLRCLQDVTRPLGPPSDVGGDVEADTDDRSDATSSDPSLSIICRDNELPVPPRANPLGITSSTIPPNSGELPSRQQQRSPEEGYSCLSCGAHEVLKAMVKRLIRRTR